MNAIRMKKKLEWTDTMEDKFHQLKQKFAESPVKSYPRYDTSDLFQVTIDWSQQKRVLSHIQNGQEQFTAAH